MVLSACETGLGRVGGGEGVYGLQRAFRLAGARSVIGSLWKVDDAATQALMTEFYRNLWEKKLGKFEALRQAQLTMIHRYAPKEGKLTAPFAPNPAQSGTPAPQRRGKPLPPYYWAAFVLNGDWR